MTNEERAKIRCRLYPVGTLDDYTFVVICARYESSWILSRHKERQTWEPAGGHIEKGETPLEAAARELWEESGIKEADLIPVCDYCGYTEKMASNGVVFLARVRALGSLPESEMAEMKAFEDLPENLTYPLVTPHLIREALKHMD